MAGPVNDPILALARNQGLSALNLLNFNEEKEPQCGIELGCSA